MVESAKQIINNKLQTLRESPFKTIVYGVSGSVAAIKAKDIALALLANNFNVVLVSTPHTLHFLSLEDYSLKQLEDDYTDTSKPVFLSFSNEDEWAAWSSRDDLVLHIELRRISHALLIAPLSANTLGKIANGLCDNLLTSICRCWDIKNNAKPLIVAPAMNTMMYEHPITDMQLTFIAEKLNIKVLPTAYKRLMCGDEGYGALIDTESIVKEVVSELSQV